MRDRVAEIHQEAVPEILRNVSIAVFDTCRTGLMIGANDLTEFLGIQLRGEGRGAYQVTEHHGHLTALGCRCGLRPCRCGSSFRTGGLAWSLSAFPLATLGWRWLFCYLQSYATVPTEF